MMRYKLGKKVVEAIIFSHSFKSHTKNALKTEAEAEWFIYCFPFSSFYTKRINEEHIFSRTSIVSKRITQRMQRRIDKVGCIINRRCINVFTKMQRRFDKS